MNILTAKEARDNTIIHVPKSEEETINFIMNKIKEHSDNGEFCCYLSPLENKPLGISYLDYVPDFIYTKMQTSRVMNFLTKLGYKTMHMGPCNRYMYKKDIIFISW